MGRARETPIVRLQLDRLQRVWADSAAHDGEQSIRGEHDAGGDQADEDTGQELTHDCAWLAGRGESRHGLRGTEQSATEARRHRENLKTLCVSASLWRLLRASQPL